MQHIKKVVGNPTQAMLRTASIMQVGFSIYRRAEEPAWFSKVCSREQDN